MKVNEGIQVKQEQNPPIYPFSYDMGNAQLLYIIVYHVQNIWDNKHVKGKYSRTSTPKYRLLTYSRSL